MDVPAHSHRARLSRTVLAALLCLGTLSWLSGCSSVPIYEQVAVSQPGMLFSDSPALQVGGSLMSTLEPGTDQSGGAAAAGCSACR